MKIRIVQRKWGLLYDRYEIFSNDKLIHRAKSRLLHIRPKIAISDLKGKEVCIVKKNLDFKHYLNYELEFEYGNLQIRSDSFVEYYIRNSEGTYSFYEQDGNLIGIYFKEVQIGYISRKTRKILEQDIYQIEYERGTIDPILLIGFSIAYDMEYHNESQGGISWHFGNTAIKPVKKVDPNWKPKV